VHVSVCTLIIIIISDGIYVTKCNIKSFYATVENGTVIEQRLDTNESTNIFKTMTKNWQTVNRRNISGQTVPKSWPPETPLHQQSSDELAGREDGWMMKNVVMIDSARRTAE